MSSDRFIITRVTDQDLDSLAIKEEESKDVTEKQDINDMIQNLMSNFMLKKARKYKRRNEGIIYFVQTKNGNRWH